MLVELEGGCRVVGLKDGSPVRDGDLLIWEHFSSVLSLRVLELHGEATLGDDDRETVLYILENDSGIYLPPGARTELSGDLTIVECGRPARTRPASRPAPDDDRAGRPISADETPAQRTVDRWYVELIQAEVTQFIGGIPPGRAPDHLHLYEEVICILDGVGVMHAGATSTPIAAGS